MGTHQFPLHLRINGGHNAYRIESETSFTEVQQIGTRYVAHRIEAGTWPERLRIADMLANAQGAWITISAEQFNDLLDRAQSR